MQSTDAALAAAFVVGAFGDGRTTGPVYVASLPNERDTPGEPGERHVATRDTQTIRQFVERWDRPGRGMFFCVSAVQAGATRRAKDTVAELAMLHADIDFKGIAIGEEQCVQKLHELPTRPSIIVRSGHGLHCYWLLKEAVEVSDPEQVARVELALRQIADLVGGDLAVAEVARLMRLPGTHNTKDAEAKPVTLLRSDYEAVHLLEDIEEMLSYMSPVVARRAAQAPGLSPVPTNPYLAAAARLGFKAPIDVQRRLEAMSYQGAGEACIHQTQVSVSAALLTRGEPLAAVVDTVLTATRAAAGLYGENWNWPREERAIRRMCEDWLKKNPVPPPAPRVVEQRTTQQERPAEVVKLEDHRPAPKKRAGAGKTPLHVVVGTAVLEALQHDNEDLLVTAGQIWRYADHLWSSPTLEGRRWLEVTIEKACRALGLDSTSKLINETRSWILRHPDLYEDEVEWDAHGKIPTRSGLVDPVTLEVTPAAAEHRATWRIECAFDPAARCPWWERMLEDFFADRHEAARAATVGAVQEILGAALIEEKSKALTKALILQGGSDSGKTSVLEVLSGLLSPAPISMALDAIGGTHGLMEFTRRAPWVIHEAFDQSKWHFSSLVKSILTGDPVQINVKNGPLITKRIRASVFWGTNHPPQFKEATKAIVNRLVVIPCRQVFSEGAPVGVALEARRRGISEPSRFILANEMPGLLNWAIAGLNRALERGHFALTSEMETTRAEIRSDSNLVDGFLRECVELSPDHMVSTPDFCAAFELWWKENKGEGRYTPSNEAVGKAISALGDARIGTGRDNERRYYLGLRLNPVGMDFWLGASSGASASGKTTRISKDRGSVNRGIPGSWDQRAEISRMRAEFEKRPPDKGLTQGEKSSDSWGDRCGDSCASVTAELSRSNEPVF